jgi:hypothetical protein
VPAQQWADEVGVSEEAGRVMEPRTLESRGQQERLSGSEGKADGVHAPEGNNPACDRGEWAGHHRGLRAGQGFRGGARERGRAHGLRGDNQGEECRPSRERLPALRGGSSLSREPCGEKKPREHKARGVMQGIGGGEGEPHAPEMGSWQSERSSVPMAGSPRLLVGTVGNHGPRDPLQGRRSRA